MRWFRLVLGAVLVVGTLSACSPKPKPAVAVTMRGDEPTVVVVTCVGRFSSLGVFRDDPNARAQATEDVLVYWGVSGDATTEIVEVTVFGEPPAGWVTEGEHQVGEPTEPWSFRVVPLEQLVPGVHYSASGPSGTYNVDFTTADLDRLDAGQVIAADTNGRPRTMAYDDFVAMVRRSRGDCPAR